MYVFDPWVVKCCQVPLGFGDRRVAAVPPQSEGAGLRAFSWGRKFMENGVDQDCLLVVHQDWFLAIRRGAKIESPGIKGNEAGFGISVKNNSHRAYSGVNSTETLFTAQGSLRSAPPLSSSHYRAGLSIRRAFVQAEPKSHP